MKTPVLSFTLSGNKYIWTTRSTNHHTSIHMHILMENITFTYIYPFLISTFITCFILIIIYILSMSSFTLLLVHVTVYYYRIAVLCFSYHIICFTYTYHFLLCFMPAKTLEADTGNKYMYPKVLSLYETVISICMYPKVLSLYETMISICMTQTRPL